MYRFSDLSQNPRLEQVLTQARRTGNPRLVDELLNNSGYQGTEGLDQLIQEASAADRYLIVDDLLSTLINFGGFRLETPESIRTLRNITLHAFLVAIDNGSLNTIKILAMRWFDKRASYGREIYTHALQSGDQAIIQYLSSVGIQNY